MFFIYPLVHILYDVARKKIVAIDILNHPKTLAEMMFSNSGVDIVDTVATSSISLNLGSDDTQANSTVKIRSCDSIGGGAYVTLSIFSIGWWVGEIVLHMLQVR